MEELARLRREWQGAMARGDVAAMQSAAGRIWAKQHSIARRRCVASTTGSIRVAITALEARIKEFPR